jgi:biotin transport system substrate-specific component
VLADALPGARARDLTLVAAGAVLMALLSQLEIPVPGSPVPITGQTLGVILCGAALGAHRGGAAILLWATLGLLLPVYADGGSGAGHLGGVTGGYIIGFVVAAYAVGVMAERGADRRVLAALGAFIAGQLLVFGLGVPWLKAATGMPWSEAVHDGFTVFIVGGLAKAVLAAALLPAAWRAVRRIDR